MPISVTTPEDVVNTATSIAIGTYFTATNTGNPAYLVVDALDRNEYTAGATGATGSFTGNGVTLDFAPEGGDGRGCGIVFTWQASTDQYVSATYGTLSQLTYQSSASDGDVTNIALFGTSSASLAQQDASNPYAMMQADAAGYIGATTIVTDPNFAGPPPAAATPDGVAAAALSFVGHAWNENGCWVLASTIAAEAGASLPIQSTALGIAGKPNGEWIVLFNGPAGGATSNWQSLVSTGDIICFEPASGGGHITTCVSGSGTTAMLVDNITYENSRGQITNPANDGSASDILVSAPHPASQEFSGVSGASVVIYALDTPIITDPSPSLSVTAGLPLAFSKLFASSDPGHRAITQYQVYESQPNDPLTLGNLVETGALSASTALTATSLAALGLQTATAGTETIDVRAFNGLYWGDWQTETITIAPYVPAPPVLNAQTANQTWKQGVKISLILPSSVFTDPQHQTLTYSAAGANGASLPAWLSFNPATRDFTGTVPAGLETFSIVVTATDTGGLSNSETFTVTVPAASPIITDKTASQHWAEGSQVSLTLPQDSFTDPQGETLTYTATLSSGAALPSWLQFSASTLSFSGTAPATAQTVTLKITATDSSGLSTSEIISAAIAKAAATALSPNDWTGGFAAEHQQAPLTLASGATVLVPPVASDPVLHAIFVPAHHSG